jgi:hypothetical protein
LNYQVRDFERALAFAGESLTVRREMGAHASLHEELKIIAGLAAQHRQPEAAARLYGAGERLREQMGFGLGWFASTLAATIRRDIRQARSQMGGPGICRRGGGRESPAPSRQPLLRHSPQPSQSPPLCRVDQYMASC